MSLNPSNRRLNIVVILMSRTLRRYRYDISFKNVVLVNINVSHNTFKRHRTCHRQGRLGQLSFVTRLHLTRTWTTACKAATTISH